MGGGEKCVCVPLSNGTNVCMKHIFLNPSSPVGPERRRFMCLGTAHPKARTNHEASLVDGLLAGSGWCLDRHDHRSTYGSCILVPDGKRHMFGCRGVRPRLGVASPVRTRRGSHVALRQRRRVVSCCVGSSCCGVDRRLLSIDHSGYLAAADDVAKRVVFLALDRADAWFVGRRGRPRTDFSSALDPPWRAAAKSSVSGVGNASHNQSRVWWLVVISRKRVRVKLQQGYASSLCSLASHSRSAASPQKVTNQPNTMTRADCATLESEIAVFSFGAGAVRPNFTLKPTRRLLQGPAAELPPALPSVTASRRLQIAPATQGVRRGKRRAARPRRTWMRLAA